MHLLSEKYKNQMKPKQFHRKTAGEYNMINI